MTYELVFDSSYGDHPGQPLVDFEERVASAAGVRNAADAALVDLTIDALAADLWQGSGIHSPVQWLMWQAGLCRATARRVTTLAARANDLPTTLSLLRSGQLSLDQAHAVARYTPAEYEASVCNFARCATVSQIISATRRYGFDVERPTSRPRERERSFDCGTDDDGNWWANIRLGAEEGAVVEQALGKVRDQLHDDARDLAKLAAEADGRPTDGTDKQLGVQRVSMADAVVGMANAVLAHGTSESSARLGRNVHIHLEVPEREPDTADASGDADPKASRNDPFEWISELHGGARLPAWVTRQLTCDCDIDLVWKRNGVPLSTSSKFRTPPARLRRLIEHRDRYQCRVPGCDARLWLQVHHIVHWEDGGSTATANLVLLCGKHRRMHHQGLIEITGNADVPDGPDSDTFGGLVFVGPYGRRIVPAGQPVTPDPWDYPVVNPYQHPTGERLQHSHVYFNHRHPTPEPGSTAAGSAPPGSAATQARTPSADSSPPG